MLEMTQLLLGGADLTSCSCSSSSRSASCSASSSPHCCLSLWFSSRTTSPHSAARIFSRLASTSSRLRRSTSARQCCAVSTHPAPPAAITPLSCPVLPMEGGRTGRQPRSTSEDSQRSFKDDSQNKGPQETIEAVPLLDHWQHPRPQPGDAAARLTHPLPSLRSAFLLIHRCRGATAAWCRGARHTGFLGADVHRSESSQRRIGADMRSAERHFIGRGTCQTSPGTIRKAHLIKILTRRATFIRLRFD